MLQFLRNLDFDELKVSQESKTGSVTGKTLCYSKPKHKPYNRAKHCTSDNIYSRENKRIRELFPGRPYSHGNPSLNKLL